MNGPIARCLAAASLVLVVPASASAIPIHVHHEKTISKGARGDRIPVATVRWVEVVDVAPPDSDEDGVANRSDDCPQTTGSLANGCNPEPVVASPSYAVPESPVYSGGASASLESIASCESGGDPTAISPDGTYRGKYQFDYGTWASVGGSGDPAAASEAEQDYRAGLLQARSGNTPWPVCGQ